MGYRSEVAIKCGTKAYEKFEKAFTEHDFRPDKVMKGDDEYVLYWDYVKWYGSYDEVGAIEDIISELDTITNDIEFAYYFVRIGEGYSDVDTQTNNYDMDYLEIVRYIELPEWDEVKEEK